MIKIIKKLLTVVITSYSIHYTKLYEKNLCFDKLISINTDYFLTDGYIRYLVAKEFGLSKIRINLAF